MLARAGADKAAVDALNDAGRRLATIIDAREGTIDVAGDEEVASALVAAGERLATASAKLDRAGNDYAKRTTGLALGRLEVLRRLAAPGPDDVVWVERVGRTRRMRIAPIAAGETIGNSLLACHPVIAVSATLGGEPPFPALARQMGFRSDAEPGGVGRSRRCRDPAMVTTTAGRSRARAAATSRCGRHRRSTGARRGSSTSRRTSPIRRGRETSGWTPPAIASAPW